MDPQIKYLWSVHSFRSDKVFTLSSKQWYRTSYNICTHPAKAWTFLLFIFKTEGLYSLLLEDQKICGIQREEKEKITGLEQQIN